MFQNMLYSNILIYYLLVIFTELLGIFGKKRKKQANCVTIKMQPFHQNNVGVVGGGTIPIAIINIICSNTVCIKFQKHSLSVLGEFYLLFSIQEMARLAKLEYEEQTKKDQELHDKIAAERAEARYTKHYESCNEVVNQLVDFTCKVAEYRELTEKYVFLMPCFDMDFTVKIYILEEVLSTKITDTIHTVQDLSTGMCL